MLSEFNKMEWPKIETPKLNISDKFAGPLITLTGFIVSLWSNILFVVFVAGTKYMDVGPLLIVFLGFVTHGYISYLFNNFLKQGFVHILSLWSSILSLVFFTVIFRYLDTAGVLVVSVAFITHVIISYVCSISLNKGFNERDPDFLKPWMTLKVIEMVCLLLGIILEFSYDYYYRLIGLVPVAVIFLVIGGYIFYCIYTAYKKMQDNPQPPSLSTTDPNNVVVHDMDKPPSYDSFENQAVI